MAKYLIKKPPFVVKHHAAGGRSKYMLEVIPEDEHEPNVIATIQDVIDAFQSGYQDGHEEGYDEATYDHSEDDE